MIIILKGADFSASNIGTLSTWRITRSLGAGAVYEGVTSVDKGASFTATVTIAEGYELGSAGVTVTMGGNVISVATVNGNVITITIAEVTGNVVIKVPTVNINTGEEEEPDIPDVPTPDEPDTPDEPVVDGNDLTSLFSFDKEKWMAVTNPQWKASSNFMSCFTDLSAYAGKTIEVTVPQYTSSTGVPSTGMSMWCTQPIEDMSYIHTRLKVWDMDTNGNGKGVLVPIQAVIPAEAPYLWTSTYMVGVAAYVGPNDGLTDFYCRIIE